MSESYNILGITVEQIENLTEEECKQVVLGGLGLSSNEPKGRILTNVAFERSPLTARSDFYFEEGLPREGTTIRFGLYTDNLKKGSQRTDNQKAKDLVVAIFSFLDDKVVANIPMMSDFNYFAPTNYFGSNNSNYRRNYEIGSDKIPYTYREFLFLLMSLEDIRSNRNTSSSSVGTDFFKSMLEFPTIANNLGLLNFNNRQQNIEEMSFLTFTHSIKLLDKDKTLYRLKFGSEDSPTFVFNYERDGVEGFGYRLKGTYLIDIVFDKDVVKDVKLYSYRKPLTIFNNFTIDEEDKEELKVLTDFLQKYVGKTYKELRKVEMVTDLRQNGLQDIANTEQGRAYRQFLMTNIG